MNNELTIGTKIEIAAGSYAGRKGEIIRVNETTVEVEMWIDGRVTSWLFSRSLASDWCKFI